MFPVGRGALALWPLVPETAWTNAYFVVLAVPSNTELASLNGRKELMLRDEIEEGVVCGPDPASLVQIFAVVANGK